MFSDKVFHFGVIGTVIAALCCFTPVLLIPLAAVSLSWMVGYLDYALWRR